MPAHRFAILTKFDTPDVTMRVTFPALLDSLMIPADANHGNPLDVERTQVAPLEYRKKERMDEGHSSVHRDPTVDRTQVAPTESRHKEQPRDEDLIDYNPPVERAQVARYEWREMDMTSTNPNPILDRTQVATRKSRQKATQTDEGFTNYDLPVDRAQISPPESMREDDSISKAIRTRRYILRDTPYTRSRNHPRSSYTSGSRSSTSTTQSFQNRTSSLAIALSDSQIPPTTIVSSENHASSSNDTHPLRNTLLAQSCFGYTAFDYHSRKVLNKDAHTSWYTYTTSGPIDGPPELPHNAMGLQHDVIFMHINETQKAKYYPGRLSQLLKYCVRMWIWNDGTSKWENISVGDQRIVNGYKLSLSLRYLTDIYPQWVTRKAMARLIADSS
ncbi:hypothetical protein EV361DRAFT_955953 [Lentinula raphanica]|nr:hypothetical protein EV361DRAFT_955953 [Lentinula raphanica]